jgi:D-mannonate dehydratase
MSADDVIEEFDTYGSLDKKSLHDKYEEMLKKVTPLVTV